MMSPHPVRSERVRGCKGSITILPRTGKLQLPWPSTAGLLVPLHGVSPGEDLVTSRVWAAETFSLVLEPGVSLAGTYGGESGITTRVLTFVFILP